MSALCTIRAAMAPQPGQSLDQPRDQPANGTSAITPKAARRPDMPTTPPRQSALNRSILAAHERGDAAALVALYEDAAQQASTVDERAFFLTHALIFALEIGAPEAAALSQQLRRMGRF